MAKQVKKTQKKLKIKKYIGLSFLALSVLFLWQLYRAPIALPFLKPYIIKALNHDDADFEVNISSVNLELVRSIKPIKIIANNVQYKNKNNSIKIDAPKVSVSFSIKALLNGMIAPSSIDILSPNIYIFKTYGIKDEEKKAPKKVINEKKISSYIEGFGEFIERFNSKDNIYSESYINSISIQDATLEFHEVELGQKFVFKDLSHSFKRGLKEIKLSTSSFLEADNIATPFGFDLAFIPLTNELSVEVFTSEFVPINSIGKIFGASINSTLNGSIKVAINLNKIIQNKNNIVKAVEDSITEISFNFEGGEGYVKFDDLQDYQYNITSILLKGSIQGGLDKLSIQDAIFDLGNQKISLGFNASGMRKLLLTNSYEDIKLSITAKTQELPFDELTNLWPKYIAPEGWTWCQESLKGGLAKNVDFTFAFAYDEKIKNLSFNNLAGKVDVFDTNVIYLNTMPTIKNVYGTAHFNNDEIKIDIQKGVSDGVSLNDGFVRLYDLSKKDSFVEIFLKAHSSIPDAIRFISHKPLELSQSLGVSADNIKGYGDVEVLLSIPLVNDVRAEDVKVNLTAQLEDVFVPKAAQNMDFTSQKLELVLDNNHMQIKGDSYLGNLPTYLDWTELFDDKKIKSNYKLNFVFNEELKEKLGLDFAILTSPYMTGDSIVMAEINVYNNNKTDITLSADLTNTDLDFAFLGLVKDTGVNAVINAKLDFEDDNLNSIPSFSFNQDGFNLDGSIAFNKDNKVNKVDIHKIVGNKTFAKAVIDISYENAKPFYKLNITGDSYNLTDFFKNKDKQSKPNPTNQQTQDANWLEDSNDAEVFIAVSSLWTIDDFPIKNFAGTAKVKNGIGLENLHLVGNYDKRQQSIIKVDYEPRGDEFVLNINSSDAGATLKVLGIYDNMKDGTLEIQAKRNIEKNLIGHAKIRNFSVHNTPVLTRLVSVASLSGIIDMITGEGLVFTHLDAPFEYKNKVITTKSAKASGNVMILTASGDYSRTTNHFNINGVIAPLRGLDKLISSIPVIGGLLTGKDGTVFAANYKIFGTTDNLEVDINPFSALSPSSLKDLVGVNNDQ